MIIAFAKGCSEFFSKEYAICINSSSLIPLVIISFTVGNPTVMVPVLSRAIICVLPVYSYASVVLYMVLCVAPFPLETLMAYGVDKPNAHGHDITSTDNPRAKENANVSLPITSQPIVVRIATVITAGTNIPDTLSAILAIGAFVAAASDTI